MVISDFMDLYMVILVIWNMNFIFPYIGMMIQSDFHIFQGGWNHQPGIYDIVIVFLWIYMLIIVIVGDIHSNLNYRAWWF